MIDDRLKIRLAMARLGRCGIILWITGMLLVALSKPVIADSENSVLFTDRTWALSGDTIWFRVSWTGDSNMMGNVLHVQLENLENEVVTGVMVMIDQGKGAGYISVPDSLATGSYWLRGYSGFMRNGDSATTLSRLITVFHRFDRDITSLQVPGQIMPVKTSVHEGLVNLHILQDTWTPGDSVSFTVDLSENASQSVRELVVSAFLDVPVPLDLASHYVTGLTPALNLEGVSFPPEKNGFLIEGVVKPRQGETLPERSLVMLSISDSIPYFDYYVTDSTGYFQFMLSSAFGTAEIFVRAVAANGQELFTDLTEGLMTGSDKTPLQERLLNPEEMATLNNLLEAAWFERIFGGEVAWKDREFRMVHPFDQAFYGEPYQRVYPSEFFDLPDFMEISRELLPGVRFRQRDNHFVIQMLNLDERYYFENSPLRLINGIPVFDNDLLYGFNSTDIHYIDIILQERVFGDISFKGILAIYMNDGNEKWLQGQNNLGRYRIPCLQIPKAAGIYKTALSQGSDQLPDFRRVFLFESVNTSVGKKMFSFPSSDLKGTMVVRLEGVTNSNEPFEIIRKIELK